jgi:hypothetical protein
MSTPNLDNLKSVRNPSPLQYAILLYGDEQSSSIEDLLDAERAAAELAAMQARIEKLEGKLALCLMKMSELNHEGYADTIAEDVFETWQEIRHKAGRA